MSERIVIPGRRDVRAALDGGDGAAAVVACPPHPQYGGDRRDERLRAIGRALGEEGVDCLRFDYGEWDEGRGEATDAGNALDWARERYDRVGLLGYSFGGAVALVVAARRESGRLGAVSALAPAPDLPAGFDAVGALAEIDAPGQVVYGTRDGTVDWEPVVERAEGLGWETADLPANHFFAGHVPEVATTVGEFLIERLG